MREHRASDARAQLLLDHVGDLVTWHDANGAVVFANAAAKALAGAEPRELLGRGLLERVHIADRPLFLKALSDAAHGAGSATACFRTLFVPRGADSQARPPVSLWLEMQAHRIENAGLRDGAAVVCVMRDVTARRALDEERARGHAEALKASDIKGQFLATVSHELRTPLNAIIGFSEMLSTDEQGSLDADKRLEYARIIHASGHHLLDVVNTLLDISKIESGAMTIEQEPLDLAEMAQDCCKLMALRAEAGDIGLERVVGPDLPSVLGDRRALKQVVINLLSNAIKFTPAGGRVVLAVVRDGDMIDLSVSDTGIGISAVDLPRLGDPFFQAKGAYDRAYEGTGLGLSVVRGLVGLHGGRLTIESAPGIGTRVAVRLPVEGCRSRLAAGQDRDFRPRATPRPRNQATFPSDRLSTSSRACPPPSPPAPTPAPRSPPRSGGHRRHAARPPGWHGSGAAPRGGPAARSSCSSSPRSPSPSSPMRCSSRRRAIPRRWSRLRRRRRRSARPNAAAEPPAAAVRPVAGPGDTGPRRRCRRRAPTT